VRDHGDQSRIRIRTYGLFEAVLMSEIDDHRRAEWLLFKAYN